MGEAEQIAVALLCLDLQKRRRRKPRTIDRDRHAVAGPRATIHIAVQQFLQVFATRLAMHARGLHKAAADDHEITAAAEAVDYTGLQHQVEPQVKAIAKDGAKVALAQVVSAEDLDRMLSQANDKAVAWAEDRAGEMIDSVRDTTRDRVRELVKQALAEGWSNDQLADAFLEDEAFSDARAEMIARTETAMADVQGNLIGWKESGVVEAKQWIVAQDGECDECAALDGEIAAIDEDFPDGDPPLHPNCRCDVVPLLSDDAE